MNKSTKRVSILHVLFSMFLFSALGYSQDEGVTFINGTDSGLHVLVITGDGSCPNKPKPTQTVFFLKAGEQKKIKAIGNQKEVCYVASKHENTNQFPLYCGTAVAPSKVDFSRLNYCNAVPIKGENLQVRSTSVNTIQKSKPGQESVVESKNLAISELSYSITSWNDPLTPPQTRTRCIREAWGHWPWCSEWRTCVEWATDFSYLRHEFFLIVGTSDSNITWEKLKSKTDQCLGQSAIAAALAGVAGAILGPSEALVAAEAAFTAVFYACMRSEIPGVYARFDKKSHWTPW